MGKRKQVIVPKRFIDRFGENPNLWSFSKINTFENCSFEYYLARVKKVESKDNIYTVAGSCSHDILEDFYNGKIKYENMINRFEDGFLDIEISDFRFSNDEEKNIKMRKKYKECMVHFFNNHNPVNTKIISEQTVWIDVNGNLFLGYVDSIHKEDGFYIITDYKSSSIYKGKKIQDQAKQLRLYALGLHQYGVELEKIKVRWNFLKYANITYKLKNGKFKTTSAERNSWVKAIETPLKKDIKSVYNIENWEVDLKFEECVKNNSLSHLQDEIKNKYEVGDCYVYPEINQKILDELVIEFEKSINIINSRTDLENDWEREEIGQKDSFYCSVLCGVKSHCKYYKKHLNNNECKAKNEENILNDLVLPWE
ncbi:hypothetical protein C4A75_09330 [Brevibacillus laterosporus]|uniref:PD-(D/E)XK nuclease family protein n=1 Tax=Brevibacillus laterosporus TaxID=1465 RepID=UPI000CE2E19E|nr:PD-(D/E)XK nuclease family protein [Brevibacillus laterosporus]PPA84969.1 hypothetical protein C4A75_09330 [Brevibacillus laterosporus]